jgi:hypothetical protein
MRPRMLLFSLGCVTLLALWPGLLQYVALPALLLLCCEALDRSGYLEQSAPSRSTYPST